MNVGTEIVTIAERARPTTDAVRQPAWPARRVRHDPHRNGVAAEAIMGHSRHRTLTTMRSYVRRASSAGRAQQVNWDFRLSPPSARPQAVLLIKPFTLAIHLQPGTIDKKV